MAANSSGGELYVLLKSNPTPQAFLCGDRTKDFFRLSRFGMTYVPLADSLGEDISTWFREDFLAKTYHRPTEPPKESRDLGADSGGSSNGSSEKLKLRLLLLRTRGCLLGEDSELSSREFTTSGTMRNGWYWEHPTAERGIREKGSGFSLITLGSTEYKGCCRNRWRGSSAYRGARMSETLRNSETDLTYTHPNFAEQAMGWPIMWTELKPLETDKYHSWQLQHFNF